MSDAELDRALRHRIYSAMAASGRAPTAAQLAKMLGVEQEDVRAALERLHAAHRLVLDAATGEVRMALPFSNVPTAFRVESGDQTWDANCAWDALAIVRLLDRPRARIRDSGHPGREPRVLEVTEGELVDRNGVISFPRPASRWWDDIVFT